MVPRAETEHLILQTATWWSPHCRELGMLLLLRSVVTDDSGEGREERRGEEGGGKGEQRKGEGGVASSAGSMGDREQTWGCGLETGQR